VRDALARAPRLNPIVDIGGQAYREIDNGRANVLVPVDNPLVSPAQRAEQRQAVVRSLFMAQRPFAGAAYGVSALAGGSPRDRNAALIAGAAADAVTSGATGRNAPIGRFQVLPRELPAARLGLPEVRYRTKTGLGQATGLQATIRKEMLGTGSRVRWNPPGWSGHGGDYNEARGHLLGKQLGGSGRDRENAVTLEQKGANNPQMSSFENGVARQIRRGDFVEYWSTPIYEEGILPPTAILVTARGSNGDSKARFIRNPAAKRR
jgi:hypothetical protein